MESASCDMVIPLTLNFFIIFDTGFTYIFVGVKRYSDISVRYIPHQGQSQALKTPPAPDGKRKQLLK